MKERGMKLSNKIRTKERIVEISKENRTKGRRAL